MDGGGRWHGAGAINEAGHRIVGLVVDAQLGRETANGGGPDPFHGGENSVPRELVGGVIEDPQKRQQILDMA